MVIKKCPKCAGSVDTALADSQGIVVCNCGTKLRFTKHSAANMPPTADLATNADVRKNVDKPVLAPKVAAPINMKEWFDPDDSRQADELSTFPTVNDLLADDPLAMQMPTIGEPATSPFDWPSGPAVVSAAMLASGPLLSTPSKDNLRGNTDGAANTVTRATSISKKSPTDSASSKRMLIIGGGIAAGVILFVSVTGMLWMFLGYRVEMSSPAGVQTAATPSRDASNPPAEPVESAGPDMTALVRIESSDLPQPGKDNQGQGLLSSFRKLRKYVEPQPPASTTAINRISLPAIGAPPPPVEPTVIEDTSALKAALSRPHSYAIVGREPTALLIRREEQNPRKIPEPPNNPDAKKQIKLPPDKATLWPYYYQHDQAILEVVDLRTGKALGEYLSPIVGSSAFGEYEDYRLAPDGTTLLRRSKEDPAVNRLNLFEMENFKTHSWIDLPVPYSWFDYLVPNSALVVGWRENQCVLLLISIKTKKILKEIACPPEFTALPKANENKTSSGFQISIHPSRRWVAIANLGKLLIVNLESGALTGPIEPQAAGLTLETVGFSADGKTILGNFTTGASYSGGLTYHWSIKDGKLQNVTPAYRSSLERVGYRPKQPMLLCNGSLHFFAGPETSSSANKWVMADPKTGQPLIVGYGFLGAQLNEREFFSFDGRVLSIVDLNDPALKAEPDPLVPIPDGRMQVSTLANNDVPASATQSPDQWHLEALPPLPTAEGSPVFMLTWPQAWGNETAIRIEQSGPTVSSAIYDPAMFFAEIDLKTGAMKDHKLFENRYRPPSDAIAAEQSSYLTGAGFDALVPLVAITSDSKQVAICDPVLGSEIMFLNAERKLESTFALPTTKSAYWMGFIDDQILAVLSGGELWGIDFVTKKVLYRVNGNFYPHATGRWEHWLIAISKPNGIDLVDGRTGQVVGSLTVKKPGGMYHHLSISPDGAHIVAMRMLEQNSESVAAELDAWDLKTGNQVQQWDAFNGFPTWISDHLISLSDHNYACALFDVRTDRMLAEDLRSGFNLLRSPSGAVWKRYDTDVPFAVWVKNPLAIAQDPKLSVLLSKECKYLKLEQTPVAIEVVLDSKERSQTLADRLTKEVINAGFKIGPGGVVLSVKAITTIPKVDPALMAKANLQNMREPIEGVLTINGKIYVQPVVETRLELTEKSLGTIKKFSQINYFHPESSRYRTGQSYNENDANKLDFAFDFGPDPDKAILDEVFDNIVKSLDAKPLMPSGVFASDGTTTVAIPIEFEKTMPSQQVELMIVKPPKEATTGLDSTRFESTAER
jgi:hypothetical protein